MTRLLTKKAVAEELAISIRTIERLLAAGELTPCRIGRAVRIDPAELRAFVERSKGRARVEAWAEALTDGQLRALHAKAAELERVAGLGRREAKQAALAAAAHEFGRAFESANELSQREASWVLDWLESRLALAKGGEG